MVHYNEKLKIAANYIAEHDPILKPIIDSTELIILTPHNNYYWELIDSIISQQLSVKSAASIERRFRELFETDFPKPQAILSKSIDDLKSVGLSRPKANYIRDLAQHIVDKKLQFDSIEEMTNQEIINMLTDIKGIGEWTAHMFLIFCLGRLDVLPVGDLGIKNAVRKLYNFKLLPTPDQIKDLSKRYSWSPYETIASMYIWRSLENTPNL